MSDLCKTHLYNPGMPRKLSKPRPRQGARLLTLRKAAGLTQTELADILDVPQANIAFWERSKKPPRSEVLPRMADALGVTVEALLGQDRPALARRSGPVGKLQQVFEEVRKLPRRQQDRIVEIVSALLDQYQKKAS